MSCVSTFKIVEHPTEYSTVIKKGSVTGVMFKENGNCFMCLQDKERYTPTIDEIQKAERILIENLEKANESRMNQIGNCPIIHENLKSYRRQYFGYIDTNGDKIIYATFNWNKKAFSDKLYKVYDKLFNQHTPEGESWKREKEMIMDGCSYYWEIKINLNKEKLFELGVNGIAFNQIENRAFFSGDWDLVVEINSFSLS